MELEAFIGLMYARGLHSVNLLDAQVVFFSVAGTGTDTSINENYTVTPKVFHCI